MLTTYGKGVNTEGCTKSALDFSPKVCYDFILFIVCNNSYLLNLGR